MHKLNTYNHISDMGVYSLEFISLTEKYRVCFQYEKARTADYNGVIKNTVKMSELRRFCEGCKQIILKEVPILVTNKIC